MRFQPPYCEICHTAAPVFMVCVSTDLDPWPAAVCDGTCLSSVIRIFSRRGPLAVERVHLCDEHRVDVP